MMPHSPSPETGEKGQDGMGGQKGHCPQGTSQGPTQGSSAASLATAGAKLRKGEDSGADYSA